MKLRNDSKVMAIYYVMIALTLFLIGQIFTTACGNIISIERDLVPLSAGGEQTSKEEYSIYLNTSFIANDKASIDYSDTENGYVSVIYTEETEKRLKVRVQGPKTLYTYDLRQGEWTIFPLTDGDGKYTVTVYRNIVGTSYNSILTKTFDVELADEVSPYLISSQYVNYEIGTETIQKAEELTQNLDTDLEKFQAIYDYVVKCFSYDYAKVKNLQSGYIPNLDEVLESGQGVCFDYAALIAGMLRSQNIPCKLVVGYMDNSYHAWISVYVESAEEEDAIYYNDAHWLNMDPTVESINHRRNALSGLMGASEPIARNATYIEKYSY